MVQLGSVSEESSMNEPYSILFVCLGNICRSPMAEGIFGHAVEKHGLSDRFRLDSAATGGWHVGNPPDRRGTATLSEYGIDISTQRCRQVENRDFTDFKLVLGMDHSNLDDLNRMAPTNATAHIDMFMPYAGNGNFEIPDPYYGGPGGFDDVYEMLLAGSEGIIDRLVDEGA